MSFIKIDRKFFESACWKEARVFSCADAWIDLIQMAAHGEHVGTFRLNGTEVCPIKLRRGEVCISLRFMAVRWQWTVKKVRVFMANLIAKGTLRAQRRAQVGAVYLLVNYDSYQGSESEKGTAKGIANSTNGSGKGHKAEGSTEDKTEELLSVVGDTTVSARIYDHLQGIWNVEVGEVPIARFRQLLKSPIRSGRYRIGQLGRAMQLYSLQTRGRPRKLEWFLEDLARWVESSEQVGDTPSLWEALSLEERSAYQHGLRAKDEGLEVQLRG